MTWIPVTERLPRSGAPVIAWRSYQVTPNPHICIAVYDVGLDEELKWWVDGWAVAGISHWQPLPPPPESE